VNDEAQGKLMAEASLTYAHLQPVRRCPRRRRLAPRTCLAPTSHLGSCQDTPEQPARQEAPPLTRGRRGSRENQKQMLCTPLMAMWVASSSRWGARVWSLRNTLLLL